ncbi:MAG: hypothetical protein P9L99_17510 [Candidatus Lernaella stagnicola]|nr:hypothetical protein [Candidatus Lernaella stagnicola]
MRRLLILTLVLVVGWAVACDKKNEVVSDEPLEPKVLDEQTPSAEDAEDFAGLIVPHGGAVELELTVYHSPTIYLTGKEPVTVLAPADPCFEFEEKQFKLDRPFFPLKIPFTVSRNCDTGAHTLSMGMRIHYALKANEVEKERNVLLEVPLDIEKRRPQRRAKRVPFEYFLDINAEIVEQEVK